MSQTKKHGGARPNAGRPKMDNTALNISTRIAPTVMVRMVALEQLYGGRRTAIENCVTGYNLLRQAALAELRGVFTDEELKALIGSLNGTILLKEHQTDTEIFLGTIVDYEAYENGVALAYADMTTLLEKVKRLTSAQVFFLQDEIELFWTQNKKVFDL